MRRLEVHRVGAWVELRVVREGAPVEAEALRELFQPFDVNAEGTRSTGPGYRPVDRNLELQKVVP